MRYISSPDRSQPPQLVLPHGIQLDFSKLVASARRAFSEEVLKEYRKTAKIVGAEPWRLFEAEQWLMQLCEDNEKGTTKTPPPLALLLVIGDQAEYRGPPDFSDLFVADQQPPRLVIVGKGGGKKRALSLKRPAAAPGRLKRPAAANLGGAPLPPPEGEDEVAEEAEPMVAPEAELQDGGGDVAAAAPLPPAAAEVEAGSP